MQPLVGGCHKGMGPRGSTYLGPLLDMPPDHFEASGQCQHCNDPQIPEFVGQAPLDTMLSCAPVCTSAVVGCSIPLGGMLIVAAPLQR